MELFDGKHHLAGSNQSSTLPPGCKPYGLEAIPGCCIAEICLKNAEVYEIALISDEYDLYFMNKSL
jgi:hypothetical protein